MENFGCNDLYVIIVSMCSNMDHYGLVKDCLKGKSAAQRELYNYFAQPMLGVCYRYTKSMNDAEDVLQEGFIKVFKNLHQYKAEGELGAWIRRIMVNTAINYLKSASRYQYDLAFAESGLHPVSDDDPEVLLNAKDLADLIRQLPAGYQTIFNLHAVEGYSHVEIGKILGINEGTSRSQYARARALLISWIKKNSQDNKTEFYARPRI
ncbi:MAG TPA: RNA polymerase sigma factor [Puia sp.]|nr:RNA polymerase sigma factor [Puia sp.]